MSSTLLSHALSPKLSGKMALITGATSGIGLATAKLFVVHGAHVFITGRRKDALDAAVKAINAVGPAGVPHVTAIQGDSADLKHLDEVIDTVKKSPIANGHLDIVFASAGRANVTTPLGNADEKHFDEMFDLNVRGTFFVVQKALPLLSEGASVILNGSVVSTKGLPGGGVYCATKAALRSFVRTWTAELVKAKKIRFNVVSPGPTDTAIFDTPEGPQIKQAVTSLVPMGRMGQPEEIATVALFLASADSSFVSGVEIFADGGMAAV